MMICSTIISKTSNFSSSGSRWARTKAKTFLEYKKCKKCVYALFAVSTLHVFATIAQPTSNLVLAQKLWSIRVCIQVCVCICIDQELAFVFLLGDINMISVFPALSGLASLGIFQSHIPIACWYPCLVSSKTGAAISSVDFEGIRPIIFVLHGMWGFRNSWTTINCSVSLFFWCASFSSFKVV